MVIVLPVPAVLGVVGGVPEHLRAPDDEPVDGHRVGDPERDAEVLEVHGEAGGPPYLVRWSEDSHESLMFPGSDAYVQHFEQRSS